MSAPRTETVPVSCNRDCIAGCPLLAHVEDGRLLKVTDNPRKAAMMSGCARGNVTGPFTAFVPAHTIGNQVETKRDRPVMAAGNSSAYCYEL